MFKPEGVYAVLLTPYEEDGSINETEVRRIVDFLVAAGVHGIFPLGSSGEAVHLVEAEKIRLLEIVADQNAGRTRIVAGVGATHPASSISLGKNAAVMKYDGVVATPPYYYKVSQEMTEKYFETIADGLDLPLILYNIPLFTQALDYDVVKRLSRHPNIVGLKDSSGSMVDFVHIADKIRLIGEDFNLLCGREEIFVPCLTMGAKGATVASACVVPEIILNIYRAWMEGRLEDAIQIQYQIPLLVRAMFALPFPLGFKVALEQRGFQMGPPKQPLSDAERFKYRTVKSRIEKIMAPILKLLNERRPAQGAA